MATSKGSIQPNFADFSAVLHQNFKELNSLPVLDTSFLDSDDDWYLLCFLKEQERNGHNIEVTLSALNSIVGALAEDSYFLNPINNKIGYLNQNHHLIGESASNKSSICHELFLALNALSELFPGRYNSLKQNSPTNSDDTDHAGSNRTKSAHNDNYSMVVSNTTEVGLVTNLSKVNTLLLHADGDVALGKLGYYEQGKNNTSAGVSLFCDASDGIRGGFIRSTGVSQIKINRPIALFNMFIASTGTKTAYMLQSFHETRTQDGVFGRVFYTFCPGIIELPKPKSICLTNVASFSHFAYAVACFFNNQYQFRHSANESDFAEMKTEPLEYQQRLMKEREKQNVTTPATYSTVLNDDSIRMSDSGGDKNDDQEQISSFKLLQTLLDDWWKSSNSSEHHLKSIRRKVVNMLSKCIWSMKVVRLIFRLLSKNLNNIDQKQGDRSTSNSVCIDTVFQLAIQASIKDYLSSECRSIEQSKWIIWSNRNDILVGYRWYLRKMLVIETLLTLKPLPDILAQRTGKKIEKSPDEVKLEKAMAKVMNFSVVFFTRKYLTSNKNGEGSGQFSHSNDLKPDQILSPLIENGLLVGGNFIKNARNGREDFKYSSFCKQLPSVIRNNPRLKEAFENLGLTMSHYEATFEHQRLPIGMDFIDEAITFLKSNDGFVQYYHNYYKQDDRFQSFREMVDERVRLGQVLQDEDKLVSSGDVIIHNRQNETDRIRDIFELNGSSSSSAMITTSATTSSSFIRTSFEKNPPPPINNVFSNSRRRTIDQETVVNHQRHGSIESNDRVETAQCTVMLLNSTEEIDLNTQLPQSHDASSFSHTNTIHKSTAKDFDNVFMDCTRNVESDCLKSRFETIQSQDQDRVHYRSSPPAILTASAAMASSTIIIDTSSTSVSKENQLPIDLEHTLDDYQHDSNMIVDKQGEDPADGNSMASAEERSIHETSSSYINALKNRTNDTDTLLTDSDDRDLSKTKRRGRPRSTNTTAQKWSKEAVNDLIINPKSSSIWKSILLKRQFVLGTSSDLFKMIPSRLFDEESRLKLIDFLVFKKLLVQDEWFRDAKGRLIGGYLKGSPADPDLAISLADFGISIEEYKRSLNPNQNDKRRIDGAMVNKSYLFNNLLQQRIKEDEWFKDNVEIDENSIYMTKTLSQTTSNSLIDEFQKQRKDKIQRTMKNKRKRTEELQRETENICGTDVPAKRQRKPKIFQD